MLVEDKVSIITGAASGIGEATAKLFAEEGAQVVAADVDVEGGEAVVEEIRDNGGEATFVETDVSDPEAVQHMIEVAVEEYGSLDVMHNNAGILGDLEDTTEYDEDAFRQIISVNLESIFYCLKYGIDAMLETGGGSIINTSSVAAERGIIGRCGYSASKGGINALTRVAAMEYAEDGIRVNAILPGMINTAMNRQSAEQKPADPERLERYDLTIPMGSQGKPIDTANAVLYLGSEMSARVTGVFLPIDNGYMSSP